MLRRNMFHQQLILFHCFSDVVMANVNVLGTSVMDVVLADVDG